MHNYMYRNYYTCKFAIENKIITASHMYNDVESTHSTSVIRTIDVEGYSILLQVWKHAM